MKRNNIQIKFLRVKYISFHDEFDGYDIWKNVLLKKCI